jgi:serine protease inhibitor
MLDGASGNEPKYIKFFVNRPFAFVIRETTTGANIFIGAVNQL